MESVAVESVDVGSADVESDDVTDVDVEPVVVESVLGADPQPPRQTSSPLATPATGVSGTMAR